MIATQVVAINPCIPLFIGAPMAEIPEKLLVNIEVTQRKIEKQLAKIAKQAGASAEGIEKRFNAANKNVAKSFGASSFAAGNLASNLNDIGVQLASGTSPFTVMVQQGSQVTQALSQAGGSASALAAVFKGAFAQILNPISLATFAIIGLGGAAIQYFTSTQEGTKEAEAALKAHAELIKTLKSAYGEAASGLNEYRNEAIEVVQALARGNLQNLQDQLKEMSASLLQTSDLGHTAYQQIARDMETLNAAVAQGKDTTAIQAKLNEELASGGQSAIVASDKYAVFKGALDAFIQSVNAGAPDITAFRTEVAKIANANKGDEELQKLAATIFDLTDEADQLQRAMGAATDAISAIGGVAAGQINDVNSLTKALGNLAGIALPAVSTADAIKANVAKGLRAIGDATTPAGAEARRRVLIAGELARQRLDATQLPGGGEIPTPTEKPSLLDYDPNKTTRTSGSRSKTNAYQSGVQSIQDRTAALEAQNAALADINPLENDYGAAVTKARITQQLLNDAQNAGLAITPDLRASIDGLATGYTSASVEARKLAENQREMQRAAAEFEALGKDVMGGFINDLIAGRSASDALANALGKVADKLIDISLNSLFDGGGGGGFNILSLLGVGGGGSQLAVASAGGIGLYAKGGIATKPSIFGESGAEAAVPLPDGRHIPVMLKGSKASGGGSYIDRRAYHIDARGAQHGVGEEIRRAIADYDRKQAPETWHRINDDRRARG